MIITEAEYQRIKNYVYNNFGVNLENKASLIEGRLNSLVSERGFRTFSNYMDYVEKDTTGEEVATLVSSLTTNFTYFYREEKHYHLLEEKILPEWTPKIKNKDLRIWSAACSSGEEPYTIAMVINDYFRDKISEWETTVLATDISYKALNHADNGIYSGEQLRRVEKARPQWITEYFEALPGEKYMVKEFMRKRVHFENFNLMSETYPFRKKIHIIFCRNVMIYFDKATREKVCEKCYNALESGGYFIVSMSETLLDIKTDFKMISSSVYQKP